MIEHEQRHQIYAGEKWMERDSRVLIPAEVLSVDDSFVYIRRVRRTRVRLERFLKHFDKATVAEAVKTYGSVVDNASPVIRTIRQGVEAQS
jgi:hypothetical protein